MEKPEVNQDGTKISRADKDVISNVKGVNDMGLGDMVAALIETPQDYMGTQNDRNKVTSIIERLNRIGKILDISKLENKLIKKEIAKKDKAHAEALEKEKNDIEEAKAKEAAISKGA